MNLRVLVLGAVVAVGLWQGAHRWSLRPVHAPDGVLAPLDPVQAEPGSSAVVQYGRWQLQPRASYDITARVLSREDYRFDALADLIPEDLALGWGRMSDSRILEQFEISQGARFYSWRPRGALPIARDEVIQHSANTHVIPATALVRSELGRLRVGQVVHLSGSLVDGRRDDGSILRTSLTRSDSGAGACEVMLVEQVDVDP